MKAPGALLLVGLCLGALVEELGTEGACTAEACAASGSALMQVRPGVAGQSGPVEEDDEYEAEEADEFDEADEVDEVGEVDRAGELLGVEWKPRPLRPCDKMPKKRLEEMIARVNLAIGRVKGGVKKCAAKGMDKLKRLRSLQEHLEKCLGPYGNFVQDGTSEETDGAEEAAHELAELGEADESDDSSELIDAAVEKPRKPPPCDKVKKHPKKFMSKIDARISKVTERMAECKAKRVPILEYLADRLDHFTKCL